MSQIAPLRVLLTGAAGHLGRELARQLDAAGAQVTGLDRLPAPDDLPAALRYVTADLADRAALDAVLPGHDAVVHTASIHPWKSYTDDQYLDANVKGTWHLYAAAAAAGVQRVVLTSSIAAAGYNIPATDWPVTEDRQYTPHDLYGVTKLAQEQIARAFAQTGQVRTVALRPPAFMPRPPLETAFGLTGCFTVVSDVAAAHVAATKALLADRWLGARPVELAAFEACYVTNPLPYQSADSAVLATAGGMQELVRRYWPEVAEWLIGQGYQKSWFPAVYSLAKAARLLDWTPRIDLAEWVQSIRRQ